MVSLYNIGHIFWQFTIFVVFVLHVVEKSIYKLSSDYKILS